MPIPEPKGSESQNDYVSRCMEAQADEDRPEEQKLAICYRKYRDAMGKAIGKAELMTELFHEKERLEGLLSSPSDKGEHVELPGEHLMGEE